MKKAVSPNAFHESTRATGLRDPYPWYLDWPRWVPFLILAGGLWAYHNSLKGPFIFDDEGSIVKNPYIRHLWPVWGALRTPSQSSLYMRPFVNLTFAINYAFGGLEVWGYHLVNLTLHLLSGLVLFGVVRRTLWTDRLRRRYGDQASWLALSIALIWLVHPLLTESVTYIIQRTELLMGLCCLLTLYCALRGASVEPCSRWWSIGAVIACFVGMGSKQVMVVTPILVALYEHVFLGYSVREAVHRRPWFYLGLAMTWYLPTVLLLTVPRNQSMGFHFYDLTFMDSLLTQCGVVLHYLRLSMWPHPLVIDYYDWPVTRTIGTAMPSVAGVLVLLGATLWTVRRYPTVGFLGLWFLIILAPSSLISQPTEIVAERRMYLPLIAVVSVIVIGGWELLRRVVSSVRQRRALAASFVLVATISLGIVTLRRNDDYHSAVQIFRDAVTKRPRNARAHFNLGLALGKQHGSEEAAFHLHEALRLATEQNLTWALDAVRLRPKSPEAQHHLGLALELQGRFQEAAAHFSEALRLRPTYVEARKHLKALLAGQTQEWDPTQMLFGH